MGLSVSVATGVWAVPPLLRWMFGTTSQHPLLVQLTTIVSFCITAIGILNVLRWVLQNADAWLQPVALTPVTDATGSAIPVVAQRALLHTLSSALTDTPVTAREAQYRERLAQLQAQLSAPSGRATE